MCVQIVLFTCDTNLRVTRPLLASAKLANFFWGAVQTPEPPS